MSFVSLVSKRIGTLPQETLADVYKSIRPEELATLAPQHHRDMVDYVSSTVGVLCSCKLALCISLLVYVYESVLEHLSKGLEDFEGRLSESYLKCGDMR